MGMSSGGQGGMMSEINVTPFVDVMLVLLIIFMVTTPLMVAGMEVELPRADASSLEVDEEQLVLSITSDGNYYIGEAPIPEEEMSERLSALAAQNPSRNVFLKADGQVPHERVAQLMSLAKLAGIQKVGLVTRPGSGVE